MYINRAMENVITKTNNSFKAILVTGPRQVGKSTILKHIFPAVPYFTFDDPILLTQTKQEPGLFFRNNKTPLILDEVQQITELFPYIKIECDSSDTCGQFNLTGSQQFNLMQHVSESLAGRIAIMELSGLSLREIQQKAFNKPFVPNEDYVEQRKKDITLCSDIWKIIHRGGYPALQNKDVDWQTFFSSYVQTYLERDINQIIKVQDKLKFTQFLTAVAARTGQMANYSEIANQVGISQMTVKNWLSVLETSGIVYIMQPFTNSALNRAIKTPKIYFRDTGLACFLTRYQTAETAKNGALAGNLFETFVVSEILKSFSNVGFDYRLYVSYYRGKDKIRKQKNGQIEQQEAEIDLIIDMDGTLYPIEIKMSANPSKEMAYAFDILDNVPQKKRGIGTILCMYDKHLFLSEKVQVLPLEYI